MQRCCCIHLCDRDSNEENLAHGSKHLERWQEFLWPWCRWDWYVEDEDFDVGGKESSTDNKKSKVVTEEFIEKVGAKNSITNAGSESSKVASIRISRGDSFNSIVEELFDLMDSSVGTNWVWLVEGSRHIANCDEVPTNPSPFFASYIIG